MAKKPVKAKLRAIVGSAKSKKSISLTKRSALFGLVGVLAFSVIAGLGWQQWQDHQLEAQAAGYSTLIYNGSGAVIKACKTSTQVKLYVDSRNSPASSEILMSQFANNSGGTNGFATTQSTIGKGIYYKYRTIQGSYFYAWISEKGAYSSNYPKVSDIARC